MSGQNPESPLVADSDDDGRTRVSPRKCVWCKTPKDKLASPSRVIALETGEYMCDACLSRARQFGRSVDVDVRVGDRIDETTQEVIVESFQGFLASMDDAPPTCIDAH